MNVLLINDSVKEYQLFVDSVNETTIPFVYGPTTTREDFNLFLTDKAVQRIGFVFEIGMNLFGHTFFDSVDYLNSLNVPTLDFLACDTLLFPEWKEFYSKLNGIIGASNNPTGNLKYGGDWTLETTMEDVEKIYFTESIEYYQYLLQSLGLNTFAFIKNNIIYGSGENTDGRLGIGSSETIFTTLQDITSYQSDDFKAKTPKFLAINSYTFFVIMTDGELWGSGSNGPMLGKGNLTETPTFINITNLNTFGNAKPFYIHSTNRYVIILMDNGELWGSSRNIDGMGIGIPNYNVTRFFQNITTHQSDAFKAKTPIFIHGSSSYAEWSLVLMSDGTLWTTGKNQSGQLGLGNIATSPTFQQVTQFGTKKVVSVTTTSLYGSTIVILEDNTIWACGSNENLLIQSTDTGALFNTFQNIGTFQSADFQSKTLKDVYTGARGVTVRMMDGSLWRQGEYDAIRLIGTISSGTSYLFQEFKPQSTDFLSKTPKHFFTSEDRGIAILMTDGTLFALYGIINPYGTTINLDWRQFIQINSDVSAIVGGYSHIPEGNLIMDVDKYTGKSYIYFGGTFLEKPYECVIERDIKINPELFLFVGNGNDIVDRIRLKAGQIRFDTYEGVVTNRTDETTKMIITELGYVGIGTTTPVCPLHVSGSKEGLSVGTNSTYFYEGEIRTPDALRLHNVGIKADYDVLSAAFILFSDRRIKDNIIDVDDDRALRDLRLLKPKTYTYKDVVSRGNTPVYGFIAQEVKEVLDYASSPITETIPNVYKLVSFTEDKLFLSTTDLSRDSSNKLFPKLKIKTREGKNECVTILEVVDEQTVRVDKDLTEWGGQLDESGEVVPGSKVFVFGQEVDDFHTLNKDAIWTVATAALQEVDRQLQQEKEKTALLQTQVATLQSKYEALLERVLILESK